ncbi:MAG: hypothetical protein JRI68_15540 [Deltaproteobacteria bacterium]|nr:hypothetical protein [Deltaproteobacteria bacterium]
MKNRLSIVLAALAAATLFATGACDDDETTTTTSSGTGGTTSSSTSGDGGGLSCADGCDGLFDCAVAECTDWEESDRSTYLNGSTGPGCLDQCAAMPAMLALYDPDDCEGTVELVSGANEGFACICTYGYGADECATGGSGGTGGAAGGSGGAGGAAGGAGGSGG